MSDLSAQSLRDRMQLRIETIGSMLAIMWVLEICDSVLPGLELDALGIRPRTLWGLAGIPLAPFLHVGFAHLAANSLPFLVLGWLVMLRSLREFWLVTGVVTLVSGLAVWLVAGSGTVHVGASGLIFGYLGYLLFRGIFERSFSTILVALLVGVLYGGALWGVIPLEEGVSWQGHLFGFLAGILSARLLSRRA